MLENAFKKGYLKLKKRVRQQLMKFKCDECGHEFESDDFPEEEQPCPGCGDRDCSFSIIE